MKRILYLSRGGFVNGSQRQLFYVVTGMQNGYEPVVVCREDGQFVQKLQEKNIHARVLTFHPWRKFPAALFRYFDAERLTSFAKTNRIAAVHCSDLWLSGYMFSVTKRLKIPSVLHIRTPLSAADIKKHNCRNASTLVAISSRIKQILLSAGISEEKITHISDAVDLNMFNPSAPAENVLRRNFPQTGNVFAGIVGRISPSKRQLEFVRSAEAIIKERKNEVTFFLIGEIHNYVYYEKLKDFIKEKGLEKNIIFTGRCDDAQEILKSLDFLVTLSGGSIMFEAAACGKPVITVEYLPKKDMEKFQDVRTGPLVRLKSIADLPENLVRMIDNADLRKDLGAKARKWAEESFDHTLMVAALEQLYDKLI